jgi:LPXTG-motif cell wall-anchored protein
MKSLRTKLAAVVIAVAAIVAAPAAANAYTPPTPTPTAPSTPQSPGNTTIIIGGNVTLNFVFASFEDVTFVLTGENAQGATLASVKTVVNSKQIVKTADAEGDVAVTVTLPSNASGTYTLAAVGETSGAASPVTLTAVARAEAGLPATGVDSASLMGVWIGGGVLLLGGLAVTVFAVRRQRETV